ncbi:MAG: mechanosensitive ion channel family protein [Limnothrix sp.]
MSPLLLDAGIIAAEILLFLIATIIIQFLIDITLDRLSKWFQPEREFNPFIFARQIFDRVFNITKALGAVSIVGINIYLFSQQKSVHLFMWNFVKNIPRSQWQMLGLGLVKSILLLMLVTLIIASLRPWLRSLGDRLQAWRNIKANERSLDRFLWAAEISLGTGLWILALIVCLNFLFVSNAITQYFYLAVRCYFILCFGVVLVRAAFVAIDTFNVLADPYIRNHPKSLWRFYPRFRYLLGLVKRCLEYAVYVAIAGLILYQVSILQSFTKYTIFANQVIGIIVFAAIGIELANVIVESLLLRSGNLNPFQRRRRLTFVPLLQNTVRYCIYFISGVAILSVFQIDPTPILAGAGILGLAVGLGAQNLINDLMNGFTILLQNYYLVGDFIETESATGIVEEMDLRVTRVRSPGGMLHIVRNGDIKTIVNYSKDYVYAVVFVGVDYESDLDHVYRVLSDVGEQVKEIHPDVLEPTRIDGLDDFGESELTIRTSTKVKPGKHLAVQRLVRKLIKEAFDREQVEIPFARRVLIFKNGDEEQQEAIKQIQAENPPEPEDGQL